jgi:DNA-binding NarL/FixJ family response regulator
LLFFVLNDQPERREGVKALLRQVHRQARISDAGDWAQLERALRRGLPDLLVVDWQMHTMTLDALRALHRDHPALSIAVLTDDGDPSTVGPLLNAGALGVIPRQLEPRLILRALELVLLGGYYVPICALGPDIPAMSSERGAFGRLGQPGDTAQAAGRMWPGVSEGAVARFSASASASTYSPVAARSRAERAALLADERATRRCARAGLLSPRQQQIMRLVHLGNTNKTIARTLNISEGTVKIHLAAVFRLLGAANRAAAVALYNGWQYGKLQVLRAEHQVSDPPPRRGMRSPIPLRSPPAPRLPATERNGPSLIAAQPAWPFAPRRRRPPLAADVADAVGGAEVEAVAVAEVEVEEVDVVAEVVGRVEDADPVQVAEVAKLAEAVWDAEVAQLAQAVGSAEVTQLAQAVGGAEVAQLAQAVGSAEVAQLAQAVGGAEVAEAADAVGAAEVAEVAGGRKPRRLRKSRRLQKP